MILLAPTVIYTTCLTTHPMLYEYFLKTNICMYILIIKQRINTNGVRVPCRSEKSESVREYDTDTLVKSIPN